MSLKIIKVGNGTKDYPGNFTKKETKIIRRNCKGKVLHLFSGRSLIGDVRVDFACKEATHNQDVFQFIDENEEYYDTIIIDAPYDLKRANKYQKINDTPKQFIIFASVAKTTQLFNYIKQTNKQTNLK